MSMRVPRIFSRQPLNPNSSCTLEAGPSQHIARALRMDVGEALLLFDGSGAEFEATILACSKKHVEVMIGKVNEVDRDSPLAIHLGIAISRGERMDWVMQKATELGATCLTPLFTERTEVKLSADRAEKKLRHWQQIVISACEQCGRNRLPEVVAPAALSNWLAHTSADRKLVLHHRAAKAQAATTTTTPGSVALLVGPEGGLSAVEIEQAEAKGFASLSLGPRVLRTETAPLAAIAILQSQWGDMALDS